MFITFLVLFVLGFLVIVEKLNIFSEILSRRRFLEKHISYMHQILKIIV